MAGVILTYYLKIVINNFADDINLESHVRFFQLHSYNSCYSMGRQRSRSCDVCGKTMRSDHLTRHMRCHEKKPYSNQNWRNKPSNRWFYSLMSQWGTKFDVTQFYIINVSHFGVQITHFGV